MGKLLLQRAFVCLCLIIAATPAIAAKRVALVIGNNAYEQVTKLQKAVNDARAMSETLSGIGFKVLRGEDLSRRDLNRQIQSFASEIEAGDEALFFFAGHGVEINGRNYLLPTDIPKATPGQEGYVTTEAIAVDSVLERIRERGARVSILVLDACRDNPFPKKGTRSVGGTRGLVRMPAPEGTFIMYSAGVGQTALDRLTDNDANANSLFTRSLIPLLKSPGLSLTETARRVRRKVQKLARTVSHEQRPAYYDEVTGNFFFAGRGTNKDESHTKSTTGRLSPAAQAWSLISDTDIESDLTTFIDAYPDSFYAKLAKSRLAKLKTQKAALLVPPKPTLPTESKPVDAPVHDCDRLAASPADPHKVTDGVGYYSISAEAAIRACRQAIAVHPGVTRFEHQLGRALSKDGLYLEAARFYRKAGEKGYAAALNNLGTLYAKGYGLDKDEREAARLYRRAAEKGYPFAMFRLGRMYADGRGIDKDNQEAARWYRKAAQKGNVLAMNHLAFVYRNGRGVEKDSREAVRWYRKAAEKGYASAMKNLGAMYANGLGVEKDSREAVRWYQKAAKKNDVNAMYLLAYAYNFGEGVKENKQVAVRWFRKAAENGHTNAMYTLAEAYDKGQGIAKDPRKAAAWMFKTLREGYDFSVKQLTTYGSTYSIAFRRELQRLMKEDGVYTGAIDGQFGPGTKRAIRALAKK